MRNAIFSQAEPLQRVGAWPYYGSIDVKFLSQRPIDPKTRSGTDPRVDKLLAVKLEQSDKRISHIQYFILYIELGNSFTKLAKTTD